MDTKMIKSSRKKRKERQKRIGHARFLLDVSKRLDWGFEYQFGILGIWRWDETLGVFWKQINSFFKYKHCATAWVQQTTNWNYKKKLEAHIFPLSNMLAT